MSFQLFSHGAVALAVLFLSQAPAATAQDQRPLTIQDVARIKAATSVASSPDGNTIAFTLSVPRNPGVDKDGGAWTELHVIDSDGENPRSFITGEVKVSHVRWSPDGTHLTFLSKRGDDEYTSLYAIPLAGGESRKLVDHEASISAFDWRADGGAIAFVSKAPVEKEVKALKDKGFSQEIFEEDWKHQNLYVVDLDDSAKAGTPRHLDKLPGQAWHPKFSPDGSRIAIDLSPTTLVDDSYMQRRLFVVEVDSGDVVAKIANPGKLGNFCWSPDSKHLALISAEDIHDPSEGRLMVVPATGGTPVDILPAYEGHVNDCAFAEDGRLLYLASMGVGTSIGEMAVDGSRHLVLLETANPVFTAFSPRPDGRSFALVGEASDLPSEVFTVELGRSGEIVLDLRTDSNPWMNNTLFGEQEVVRYHARDGLLIEGMLIHPLERDGGERVPLIVVAHGGPESHYKNGWLTRYSAPGHVGAAAGYAVFYPNYRSSTGRGVAFSKHGQGDAGGKEFDDVVDGVDYLVGRGMVDKDRVGITGGSYGGYFTAWAATRHSTRFAAGVMFVGLSNHLSKSGTSDIPREMELVHWRTNPLKNPQLFLERSPITYVHQAETPLLILHGKEDPRVDPGQSHEMFRALKTKGDVPVRLVLYPGEGHGNRRAASRYDYNLRMMRWMDHFLKEDGKEPPPAEVDYGLSDDAS